MPPSPATLYICPPDCADAGSAFHWHGAPDSDLSPLLVPIGDLTPYHRNPRRGDIPVIAASLRRHGQYRPVVVNDGTHTGYPNEVLAGNHTLLAARDSLGWTHLARTQVDVDAATARRIVLADNGTADLGGYEDALLLELLLAQEGDLEGLGYTDESVTDLLARFGPPPSLDDLARLYGDPEPDDLWPRISVAVPRDLRSRFLLLMAAAGDGEDWERFARIVAWAEQARHAE